MRKFIMLALFGLAAQLVDGGLGMAYGLTSSTLLLAAGLAPAMASASVHMAEVGTTFASGLAHHKLGNTDWRVVRWLALPGAVGAFTGAVLLSNIHGDVAKPYIAAFLFLLGLYLLVRFAILGGAIKLKEGSVSGKFLLPLGIVAGFLDAVGGGGWGPISTPALLASGKMEPRRVVGTVSASEFLVAASATIGFLISLDRSLIALQVVGALLVGGLIAAPIAAVLVKWLHPRVLGTMVGGLIILTNGRTLLKAVGLPGDTVAAVLWAIAALWVAAIAWSVWCCLKERRSREAGSIVAVAAPAD
ncbi:MAG: sulfite exporter TauE/SafE family protein [Chloroflexota bacterium]